MRPALLALLVLLAAFAQGAPAGPDTRPNIVLVIGEDMGPDTGAYGCKDAITPNMDRLAREGALFTGPSPIARSAPLPGAGWSRASTR